MENNIPEITVNQLTPRQARQDRACLCGVHMSYYAGTTIQSTFLVTFMGMMGYNATEIGIVVALYSITNLLCQPMWGYLSDKYRNVKMFLRICLLAAIPLLLILPLAVSSHIVFVAALYAAIGCFMGPCAGLIDSLSYSGMENNKYIVYSFVRGMGSLFSSFTMLVAGMVLERLGIKYAFAIEAGLLAVTVICLSLFRNGRYGKEIAPRVSQPEDAQPKLSLKKAFGVLLKNKAFVLLFLSVLLLNIGMKASYTFSPLMVLAMGGSTADNGYVMAINTAGMMPCMLLYTWLLTKKKVSNNTLFIWGCVFTIARIVSLVFVRTLPQMFIIQLICSFQYGFLQPATMAAVASLVPVQLRSSAITLTFSFQVGVASLLGDFVAGKIVDTVGMQTLFRIFTVLAVAGLLLFIASMRAAKKNRPAEIV